MAYFVADSVVVSSAEIRVVAGRVDGVDSQLNVIQERLEKIDQILSTPSTIVSPYTGDDK
jgi:small nuclear ribonucleoprotein (snRNP)-like protein